MGRPGLRVSGDWLTRAIVSSRYSCAVLDDLAGIQLRDTISSLDRNDGGHGALADEADVEIAESNEAGYATFGTCW